MLITPVHLLKCLTEPLASNWAVQGAEPGWYLQPGWTSPDCHQDLRLHFSVTAFQCEAFEAQRVHPPPLQGIPLPHSLILAWRSPAQQSCLWTLSAVPHVCTFPRKVPHSWLEPSQPPPELGTHLLSIVFQAYSFSLIFYCN